MQEPRPREVDAGVRPEDGPQDVSQEPGSIVLSTVPDPDAPEAAAVPVPVPVPVPVLDDADDDATDDADEGD